MKSFTNSLLTTLCVVLLVKVSTGAPVQNDGPYVNNNNIATNNVQSTYLPASSPSNINNIQVAPEAPVDQQNIYLHLPQEQQQQQIYPPYYPYVQPKRKHYKIIVVRPPPQPTQPPAPPQPEIEEQTIVYVLVKKPDEPKIDIEQTQPVFKSSKPEVYFIKYQTKNEQDNSSQPQPQIIPSTETHDGGNVGDATQSTQGGPY